MKNEFLETIKIFNGEIFNLDYHQRRYESVLNHFEISKVHNLKDFINPPKEGLFRCRLVYDFNKIDVSYHEYKQREIKSFKLVYDDKIDYSFKSTNRATIDNLFASRAECDEILIVKNSLISDTSIANVAFYDGKKWLTPKVPLLKGTTRARLLDESKIYEADIRVEDLSNYTKINYFNAMIDFKPDAGLKICDAISCF